MMFGSNTGGATQTPTLFGGSAFGTPGGAPTSFGAPTTSTANNNAPGFSFSSGAPNVFNTSGTSFGATMAPSGIGTTFSQPNPTQNFTGNVFGPGLQTATQPNMAQPTPSTEINRIVTSVTLPLIYRDERDMVLTLFNQLQAKWGVGKGFMAQTGPPAIFTPENPFCKFKTIAYNALPTNRPEEGFVCLLVNKKAEDIRAMTSPSFSELLHKEVIKVPELSVYIDSVHEAGVSQSNVVIYVLEKSSSGQARKLTSTELLTALESPISRNALNNLGVINMAEKTEFNKAQLEYYLTYPPRGIDALLWEQAKNDNPDPKRLVPVPVIGFDDLRLRTNSQRELQIGQMNRLEKMCAEAIELERKCEQTRGRVEEFRHRQRHIAHRVLKVMVAFEVNRKIGLGIQSEEETLKASLEEIMNEMEILKSGKLNELQASVKSLSRGETQAGPAEPVSEEISAVLTEQHRGIADLIKIMNEDIKKLDDIKKALTSTTTGI